MRSASHLLIFQNNADYARAGICPDSEFCDISCFVSKWVDDLEDFLRTVALDVNGATFFDSNLYRMFQKFETAHGAIDHDGAFTVFGSRIDFPCRQVCAATLLLTAPHVEVPFRRIDFKRDVSSKI